MDVEGVCWFFGGLDIFQCSLLGKTSNFRLGLLAGGGTCHTILHRTGERH